MFCVIVRLLSSSEAQCGVGQTEADHSSVAMLTLASKLKRDDGGKTGRASGASDSTHRVSIRDRLLTKGRSIVCFITFFFDTEAKQTSLRTDSVGVVSC